MANNLDGEFLDGLSDSARNKVQKHAKQICPAPGDTLIRKGDPIGGAFFVESGSLRVYTLDFNGNEKPIYTVQTGELCVFSVNCIFNNILYPAWVTNKTDDTRILSIDVTTFQALYEQEVFVRDYVVHALSKRIFDLMSTIEVASTQDIGQRINSYLIRSCQQDGVLHTSHQDIATYLGTAREVVSRHLKQLENAGHVQLSRMKITVLSPSGLSELVSN